MVVVKAVDVVVVVVVEVVVSLHSYSGQGQPSGHWELHGHFFVNELYASSQ